ncbi:aspartate carbamoyltransferase regulatory subunit [Candidatus Acetothermia bacterium]|jgi:aspartate carbamoyltransferase regulatory subunit|nr:aspartate carbamoyltransferase regulatory subunit [Candidatus Acetothermia bacterium]MCI2430990.1 aspartate carbamoyltransferase regulatory subunit [Candidatus Acetothermia bacterium]MCI2436886.1 aspartate carbamoyltransferase regulatory subunit [Candidatus Acetothermia bacterium]
MAEELKVSKIKNGTVIDHITAGMAPSVLRILGIHTGSSDTVIVAMNVKSAQIGLKDMVKVENRVLAQAAVRKIALVAPQATVNIIRDYKVAQKLKVELPTELIGIVRCPNRNCITNSSERVSSYFAVESKDPLALRCHYCEALVDGTSVDILL